MQGILIVIFCFVCHEITAQTTDIVPTISTPSLQSGCEDSNTARQVLEESKTKRNKFSCVLNLLKNALAEELHNSYYLTENIVQNDESNIDVINEKKPFLGDNETQIEKPILKYENKTEINNEYENVITKPITPYFNHTTENNNLEMPTMIPIFKPRPQPRSEINQNEVNFSSIKKKEAPISKPVAFVPEKIIRTVNSPMTSQIETNQYPAVFSSLPISTNSRQTCNSRPIAFVPEKIVQTNMSPIPNQSMFNIPCQRAADVLDMGIAVPQQRIFRNTKGNLIPEIGKSSFPNQIPAPIDKRYEDDTVTMLFKPKNITFEQVYGNMLKKITITVLVPYHMSKLGNKTP